jgi:hypothetical protein
MPPLTVDDRVRVYAAVLQELRRDSVTRVVVLDTLMPSTDVAADQVEMVRDRLQLSRAQIDAFFATQRAPADRFSAAMLQGDRMLTAPQSRLDSLRVTARAEASAPTSRETRSDVFWRHWYAAYPNSSGYVILSPAMITTDGRDAVIQVTVACGSLCGTGELRRLRRDANGVWRTTAKIELWVS